MNAEPSCLHPEQAVGWALHALEPAEEDAFTEHLPQCRACRELVRQTEDVMSLLASAEEQIDPRPELRAELMSAVATTPQTPKDQREPVPTPGSSGVAEVRGPRPSREDPWSPPRPVIRSRRPERAAAPGRSTRRRRLAALVAAVAVAVIGLGGLAVRQIQSQQQRETVNAQSAEVGRVLAQLDRPGARHALLNSPGGQPVAAVMLYNGERQITPFALPANVTDQTTYVLWGMGHGRPRAVGTFDVGSSDKGLRSVGSVAQPDEFSGYAVSIENGRGAPAEPSQVVASGQVAS